VSDPSLSELLDVATEAAYLAGKRTLAYFNAGVGVETKANDTPVTLADKEAERIIRERIARYFPGHAILGEEEGETPGSVANFRWIIDPLDGTKSFIHGVPLYGVLVAVEIRGRADVGVVYLPALDEMVTAATGLGCRWNGRPARVSSVSSLKEATLSTTSPLGCIKRSDAYEKLAERTKLQRAWGDCYGYVLVATGRAEIMLDRRMNVWDCGPLLPILQEAGGRFTDWKGEATIWGGDAVATNGMLHDPVVEVLRSEKLRGSSSPSS
jgi:histidinol phosphatase-like enzyme (inositol monophosphatase family)